MAARVRRRSARGRTARARRNDAVIVAAMAAMFVVVAAARWVDEHRAISAVAGAVVVVVGAWWVSRLVFARVRAHRSRWAAPTALAAYLQATPDEFEQQTAALCRRDGCSRVRVVGGAGDLAADVLATTPDGRRVMIQCKRYAPHNKVGSDHVQRVNGTYRDIHRCQVAAIVTTSGYTVDAARLARRVGIRLYDADDLAAWARGGRPPWA